MSRREPRPAIVETLIWLAEASAGERQGIDQDLADAGDGGPFPRLCAKIATGSGKTLVMAMAQGRGARAAEPANELLRLGIEANGGRHVEISSCV
ncbi:MAG TPA: hypothetical protein VMT79_11360 [Candidatus Binatia bacterium]|nr:hypothetical protein [Candidatus Binatia bacterium]